MMAWSAAVATTRNRAARVASLCARTTADAATIQAHLAAHDATVAVTQTAWPGAVVSVDLDAVRANPAIIRDVATACGLECNATTDAKYDAT
ncbi:MAG: hypothetical protein C0467_22750 [Planctomycetaceae bacterium]|nr:hypothetical protein [Planctomycetaceae bacterium]